VRLISTRDKPPKPMASKARLPSAGMAIRMGASSSMLNSEATSPRFPDELSTHHSLQIREQAKPHRLIL